jgi:hypothetical protein
MGLVYMDLFSKKYILISEKFYRNIFYNNVDSF